ncbi:hypothetical protein [Catenovulum sediminis]|uniref:hypothetical protein n=1 Tax=Catenovulum sediminis TaxID=1740262 RepID=UPI00117D189A|nr:hypothetical protein [Catenovulum sediminis]
MNSMPKATQVIKCTCLAATLACVAGNVAAQGTQISGFGSIAGYHADSTQLGFRSDIAAPEEGYRGDFKISDLSRLGLQINHQFNKEFELVTQAVLQEEMVSSDLDRVKIATLNYTPSASWLVRVGRFSPRIYFLSESRYISYAHDTVYPVHDFYAQIPLSFVDGFDATYQKRVGSTFLKTNFFAGQTHVVVDVVGVETENEFDWLAGLNFEVEYGNWLYRASYTQAQFEYTESQNVEPFLELLANPGIISPLKSLPNWQEAGVIKQAYSISESRLNYASVAFEYRDFECQVRGEFGKLTSESDLAPDSTAGYLQYSYRSDVVTPFIIASAIKTDEGYQQQTQPNPMLLGGVTQALGFDAASAVVGVVDALNVEYEQKSLAIGMRWDFDANIAVKAQYERSWVEEDGGGLWIQERLAYNDSEVIDVMAFSIDWIF